MGTPGPDRGLSFYPKVARAEQSWALGRNPFGIGAKLQSVSGQSKPARTGQLKTGQFEGHGIARQRRLASEPTQIELTTGHQQITAARLVASRDSE